MASRGPDVSNWMLGTRAVSTSTPESYCSIASHLYLLHPPTEAMPSV